GDDPQPDGRLVGGEGSLKSKPVDGACAFNRNEFARNKRVEGTQFVESSRFTQDDAQQGRGVDVRDHRRRRSSSRTATLSVRFAGFGGSFRSRTRRCALRISSGGAAKGTILAIGVSRSSTVSVPPLRTDRRCSLSL